MVELKVDAVKINIGLQQCRQDHLLKKTLPFSLLQVSIVMILEEMNFLSKMIYDCILYAFYVFCPKAIFCTRCCMLDYFH